MRILTVSILYIIKQVSYSCLLGVEQTAVGFVTKRIIIMVQLPIQIILPEIGIVKMMLSE